MPRILGALLMGNRIVPIGIAVLILTLTMVVVAAVSLDGFETGPDDFYDLMVTFRNEVR